jgi:membrane-associated phospholipid phosphatase
LWIESVCVLLFVVSGHAPIIVPIAAASRRLTRQDFMTGSPTLDGIDHRFWGWPDLPTLRTFVWAGLGGACWFALIFGGSDFVTSHRTLRVAIHFETERRIPFVPAAVWVYMTIYALVLMAPFVLRSPQRLIALAATHATVVLVAGIGFLLFPADLAYQSTIAPAEGGATAGLYRFADWLNLDYNLLPSLHVALSVTCVAAYAPHARRFGRVILWSWAIAVALSTIFTHFHHVLDALSGFMLGLAGARVVYGRLAGRSGRSLLGALKASDNDRCQGRQQGADR